MSVCIFDCNAFFSLFFWSFLDKFVCTGLLFCLFLEFVASAVTCLHFCYNLDFSRVSYMSHVWRDARKITCLHYFMDWFLSVIHIIIVTSLA